MKFRLISDYNDMAIDRTEWNNLVAESQTNTVFQTYEWFDCWWQTFGQDYQFAMFICEDHDGIQCIAPLMISQEKNGKRFLRFAGDLNSDYCDIIARGNKQPVIRELIHQIFSADIEFDTIVLRNIPSYSTTHDYIFEVCRELDIAVYFGPPSPSPKLSIRHNKNDVAQILNKYSVRRPYNKLNKSGKVNFRTLENCDAADMEANLENFFTQHIWRYRNLGMQSLFIDDKYRKFYLKLLHEMSHRGWIHFSVLEFDSKPIAYHFGFIYDQKMIWYKPTFDPNFSKLSPGSALLMLLIEYCQQHDLEELDFTIGDEPYKQRFCNTTAYNKTLFVHKSKVDYYLLRAKRALINTPVRIAKHLRRLRNA